MIITTDSTNRKLILELDDNEWDTANHLNKKQGINFIKNHFEKFFQRRAVQREGNRKQKVGLAFKSASPEVKQQILNLLALDLKDD